MVLTSSAVPLETAPSRPRVLVIFSDASTAPSVTVSIVRSSVKLVAAAIAEYSRSRSQVPAATTLKMIFVTVILPVGPAALAPLKVI